MKPMSNDEQSRLLRAIGSFRCLSTAQLEVLCPGVPRQTQLDAVRDGLVRKFSITSGYGRVVYFLTKRAFTRCRDLHEWHSSAVTKINTDIAIHGWQRAQLWSRFIQDGWLVGRDRMYLRAVVAFLNASTEGHAELQKKIATCRALTGAYSATLPFACPLCGCRMAQPESPHPMHRPQGVCYGRMRRTTASLFDIAFRQRDDNLEIRLLLVDQPYRSLSSQLFDLPLDIAAYDGKLRRAVYPRKLPVIFVPGDDGSVFDPHKRTWTHHGNRLSQLMRLKLPREGSSFPFHNTTTFLDPPAGVPFRHVRRVRPVHGCRKFSAFFHREVCNV